MSSLQKINKNTIIETNTYRIFLKTFIVLCSIFAVIAILYIALGVYVFVYEKDSSVPTILIDTLTTCVLSLGIAQIVLGVIILGINALLLVTARSIEKNISTKKSRSIFGSLMGVFLIFWIMTICFMNYGTPENGLLVAGMVTAVLNWGITIFAIVFTAAALAWYAPKEDK